MTDTESIPHALVISDINIDIILNCDEFPVEGDDAVVKTSDQRLGGSGCNTAVVLSSLDIPTQILGHIGGDPFSVVVRKCLEESGIDTSWVMSSPSTATGMMMIVVTPDGQRTMFGLRGCNSLTYGNLDCTSLLHNQSLVHISGYTFLVEKQWEAVKEIIIEAHSRGITVSLDPGIESLKVARERVLEILPYIDDLLVSEFEYALLVPQLDFNAGCKVLLNSGVKTVILKMGAQGSLSMTCEGTHSEPAFYLPGMSVVNTTGAGDCFNAGFLLGQIYNLDTASSMIIGNAIAYHMITLQNGMDGVRLEKTLQTGLLEIVASYQGPSVPSSISQLLSLIRKISS